MARWTKTVEELHLLRGIQTHSPMVLGLDLLSDSEGAVLGPPKSPPNTMCAGCKTAAQENKRLRAELQKVHLSSKFLNKKEEFVAATISLIAAAIKLIPL